MYCLFIQPSVELKAMTVLSVYSLKGGVLSLTLDKSELMTEKRRKFIINTVYFAIILVLFFLFLRYAFQPLLRPRLTRSRSALLRKPWIFGHKDSHLVLATHSSILSSCPSTAPYGTASPVRNAPLPTTLVVPELRCRVSAPDIFGAGTLDQ